MNNGFDLSMLQKLTSDPEMMSRAISMAQTLAKSGALGDLLGNAGADPGGTFSGQGQNAGDTPGAFGAFGSPGSPGGYFPGQNDREGERGESGGSFGGQSSAAAIPEKHESGRERGRRSFPPGTHEQRIKLLEAMRPFVPKDRRTKIDFIIKLLGLIEIANGLGLKNILQ